VGGDDEGRAVTRAGEQADQVIGGVLVDLPAVLPEVRQEETVDLPLVSAGRMGGQEFLKKLKEAFLGHTLSLRREAPGPSPEAAQCKIKRPLLKSGVTARSLRS
jgi:hypothetical protein